MAATAAAAMLATSAPIHAAPAPVPVTVAPEQLLDACGATAQPSPPAGGRDGFLSLRAGPGTIWRETARLRAADLLAVCGKRGGWTAVIVTPANGADCRIVNRSRALRAYAGPCRHGWVSTRLVRIVAG